MFLIGLSCNNDRYHRWATCIARRFKNNYLLRVSTIVVGEAILTIFNKNKKGQLECTPYDIIESIRKYSIEIVGLGDAFTFARVLADSHEKLINEVVWLKPHDMVAVLAAISDPDANGLISTDRGLRGRLNKDANFFIEDLIIELRGDLKNFIITDSPVPTCKSPP